MEKLRRLLVVDPSKVVRAALAKHLKDDFDIREEADGESAWQTLVLDSSIVAVVSAANLPRQSGYDLLAKLRMNRLRRLADIPFLLLISDSEPHDSRQLAKEKGVTDFITRGMSGADIQHRIRRLVDWELAMDMDGSLTFAHTPGTPPAAAISDLPRLRGLLLETLAPPVDSTAPLACVVAFGLDNEDDIAEQFGPRAVSRIWSRFTDVIRQKIGRRDVIGTLSPSRCLIISPGTSHATCFAFAQRVCRGLHESSIRIGEIRFTPSISVGIAALPDDTPHDADALITLAQARLDRAQADGGNRVIADDPPAGPLFGSDYFLSLAQNFCSAASRGQLATLGLQLMPLLELLDRELDIRLPLEEMTERLVAQTQVS